MVKGISKQVLLVRPQDKQLFEQAIFILRDDAQQGVSEQALLQEAAKVAAAGTPRNVRRFLWLLIGAAVSSGMWGTILMVAQWMKVW